MAVAITKPCDKWCDSMVFAKRVGKTCTYTYTLKNKQTSSDDPARAEKIRYTVKQYTAYTYGVKKPIKIIDNVSKLNGSFTFDLVDGCDIFDLTMQLLNRKGGKNNVHTNRQWFTAPPPKPYDLSISFDGTETGNNLECYFKCKYNEDGTSLRNQVRKSYKVLITREQSVNNKVSSRVIFNKSDQIGWDNLSKADITYRFGDALPNDNNWIHYQLYVIPVTLNYDEKTARTSGCSETKHYYIARPPTPTIKGFTKSNIGDGGLVRAVFNLEYKNGVPSKPMDKIKLQYIWSVESPGEGDEWNDVSNTDQEVIARSGNITTVFAFAKTDISSGFEAGKHLYVRTEGYYEAFGSNFFRHSNAYMIPDKYYFESSYNVETSAPEGWVKVTSLEADSKGDSLYATIDYDTKYYDTTLKKYIITDACQVSYSDDKNAWISINQPSTYDMPDLLWKTTSSGTKGSSKIRISGLSENTTYYVRALRYSTTNDATKSAWSKLTRQSKMNTGDKMEKTVVLTSAKNTIAVGTSCSFSWTLPDDLEQTKWTLKSCEVTETKKEDDTTTIEVKKDIATLASGINTATSTSVTFNAGGTTYVYLTSNLNDNEITLTSTPIAITVVNPPTVEFVKEPLNTLTSFPYEFSVKTDTEKAKVNIKITTNGMQRRTPEGFEYQYQNDVIYSETKEPDTDAGGVVEFSLDDSISSNFWESGIYTITATAIKDDVSSTKEITKTFTVNFVESLQLPNDSNISIVPQDDMSVTVQVKNISDNVTWELYRSTVDNRNPLIANGLKNEEIITDKFAPYATTGNCYYIILIRNKNNQFVFKEYEYTMIHRGLRFDWLDRYVELPYNVQISDANDKQFEQQVYLDGSQRGAWGSSVIRTSSLSTDTVYIKDEETQKKVRELARYQGGVFVRTSLGQAYVANVEVSSIEKAYNDKVMPVSFDCTEIDLTDNFMATKSQTEETI